MKASRRSSLPERFWTKVRKTDTCWLWLAGRSRDYGSFAVSTAVRRPAHRVAYELLVGPIPDGMVLDHLCRNTLCVNPEHLEPVSIGENVRRGLKTYALRDTCKWGHDITDPANVKTRTDGRRECRVCARASWHNSPSAEQQHSNGRTAA